MRVVIQRVSEAAVVIENIVHANIDKGFLILLGISTEDSEKDIEWLIKKISQLRIFQDDADKMNLSINDIGGSILVISQFTLMAGYKKGNRPSFIKAARPEHAIPLYEQFLTRLDEAIKGEVKSGIFGADMKVRLTNDGPVTINMDSISPE